MTPGCRAYGNKSLRRLKDAWAGATWRDGCVHVPPCKTEAGCRTLKESRAKELGF